MFFSKSSFWKLKALQLKKCLLVRKVFQGLFSSIVGISMQCAKSKFSFMSALLDSIQKWTIKLGHKSKKLGIDLHILHFPMAFLLYYKYPWQCRQLLGRSS